MPWPFSKKKTNVGAGHIDVVPHIERIRANAKRQREAVEELWQREEHSSMVESIGNLIISAVQNTLNSSPGSLGTKALEIAQNVISDTVSDVINGFGEDVLSLIKFNKKKDNNIVVKKEFTQIKNQIGQDTAKGIVMIMFSAVLGANPVGIIGAAVGLVIGIAVQMKAHEDAINFERQQEIKNSMIERISMIEEKTIARFLSYATRQNEKTDLHNDVSERIWANTAQMQIYILSEKAGEFSVKMQWNPNPKSKHSDETFISSGQVCNMRALVSNMPLHDDEYRRLVRDIEALHLCIIYKELPALHSTRWYGKTPDENTVHAVLRVLARLRHQESVKVRLQFSHGSHKHHGKTKHEEDWDLGDSIDEEVHISLNTHVFDDLLKSNKKH